MKDLTAVTLQRIGTDSTFKDHNVNLSEQMAMNRYWINRKQSHSLKIISMMIISSLKSILKLSGIIEKPQKEMD